MEIKKTHAFSRLSLLLRYVCASSNNSVWSLGGCSRCTAAIAVCRDRRYLNTDTILPLLAEVAFGCLEDANTMLTAPTPFSIILATIWQSETAPPDGREYDGEWRG